MPAVYDKMGIRFSYPENWTLDEAAALEGERSVTVYSPTGAFWSIALHPPEVEPDELASTALMTLKTEYAASEAEPASEEVGELSLKGFDLHFFYLDFTNTAIIRGFRTDSASCLLLCQAEDRDYDRLSAVFRAITTSFEETE